jgi:hypothetical protein
MRGGPVSRESFSGWWAKFKSEELGQLLDQEDEAFDLLCGRARPRAPDETQGSRLTGRQLFEQKKVHSTSDLSFLGDEQCADEAVFEDLDGPLDDDSFENNT